MDAQLGKSCTAEVVNLEGFDVLKVNCYGCPYGCSLEDSKECMSRTIQKLLKNRRIDKIQLESKMVKEYDSISARHLKEVA